MTAAQPPPRAPAKQHLVPKYHVEVLAGEDSAAALPLADAAAPAAGQAAAADVAAEQAAAAVEPDEPMLDEPQEDKSMRCVGVGGCGWLPSRAVGADRCGVRVGAALAV